MPAPEIVVDPVASDTPLRFTGTITLTGRVAHAPQGTIEIAVRRENEGPDLLARTYAVDDPCRTGDVLAFGLTTEDAVGEPLPRFSRSMVLVARFDRDGDPRTRSPEDLEVAHRVDAGATDLFVSLGRGDVDAARSVQVETR